MERFENVMTVSYRWVRILLTNDDGVHAPGLAAITEALSKWARDATQGDHELVVVAPLANHSGASAAVGTVYERETIAYRAVHIPGAEDVDAFGVDAPPALATIVAVLGAFGPKPDLIVSGVNLGANVGRSVPSGPERNWGSAGWRFRFARAWTRPPGRPQWPLPLRSCQASSRHRHQRSSTSTSRRCRSASSAESGGVASDRAASSRLHGPRTATTAPWARSVAKHAMARSAWTSEQPSRRWAAPAERIPMTTRRSSPLATPP